MRKFERLFLLVIIIFAMLSAPGYAQMAGLHGDFAEMRDGLHAGNQFRTTFFNDGTFGARTRPPDIGGEWPINSGHIYMLDGNAFIGSEVIDRNGELKHIFSEVCGPGTNNVDSWSTGDMSPDGEWRTFLPLFGFANPDTNKIAMSKWKWAWPPYWPDIADPQNPLYSEDGWAGSWNGYFGKDVFNADEESYFVSDDYANDEFVFYPDDNDLNRRGLGLRMYVRGFQWSNALVQDALFALFDLENIGTHDHDKMVFAYKFGNNMGDADPNLWDAGDDMGAYNREQDVAYLYDYDDIGAGYSPVGYFGGAFLESPGNPYDGIDNDGDGVKGSGPIITEDLFVEKELKAGDEIILIDYDTFARTKTTMPNDTLRVHFEDQVFKYWPGKIIKEERFNLVDDNLNGIIDENNGATFGEGEQQTTTYLYVGPDIQIKYVDYFSGQGIDNILIDERRDDGIDNDGDWDVLSDDLGADGKERTRDRGEGDGIPTYGEPHFDKTDIDETDMLGLTAFTLYKWETIPHWDDEGVWQNVIPGFFDDLMENDNIELLYGSGYFPMKAGQVERFSMGIMCGINLDAFLENKFWVAKAYNENYNFAQAPPIPDVTAIPGDKRVTLVWDDKAEKFRDPIAGYDFEGYRIYRSTDPGWNDLLSVTDGYGVTIYRKPLKIFDLDNEYSGFMGKSLKGVYLDLGTNSGIQHMYVDTTVKNGYTYFYAVTSFDHGDSLGTLPPTECSKFISLATTGEVEDRGPNVVMVRPEAPAAGYVPASFENSQILRSPETTADGNIGYEIVFPDLIKDGQKYWITFEDSTVGQRTLKSLMTKSFTVTNLTSGEVLVDKSTAFSGEELPVVEGFRLKVTNTVERLALNSTESAWSDTGMIPFSVSAFYLSTAQTDIMPGNFQVIIGDVGIDTSTVYMRGAEELKAQPVNFTIRNTSLNKKVKFALRERDVVAGQEGHLTSRTAGNRADEVIFLTDSLTASWMLTFTSSTTDTIQPGPGDVLTLIFDKPFLANDMYEFSTQASRIDPKLAKQEMDNIKVVPNPYIVANSWERENPYSSGRGPRELHFTHLPPRCTIKIFNLNGQLVVELNHEADIWDGAEAWDLKTKDFLDVAYGVYIYHISAPDIGEKIGKFAIIK